MGPGPEHASAHAESHDLHSPLSSYFVTGHSFTQTFPSLEFLQLTHKSDPDPVQPLHSSWQVLHSPLSSYLVAFGHALTQKSPSFVTLQASQLLAPGPEQPSLQFSLQVRTG